MKLSRLRISVRVSRAISASRPRVTKPVKNVWASLTGILATSEMDRSRHNTARDTRFRRSPWQAGQVCDGSSLSVQVLSSPVWSASKPCICSPVPKHCSHQPCLELYENMRGSGSGKLVPQLGHARFTEKWWV